MSADAKLLKLLSKREDFDRYSKYIQSYTVLQETNELIGDMKKYLDKNPSDNEIDWDKFKVFFATTLHPNWKPSKRELYNTIVELVAKEPHDPTIVQRFIDLDAATKLKKIAEKIINGSEPDGLGQVDDIITNHSNLSEEKNKQDYFIDSDLSNIIQSVVVSGGMDWRLPDLNLSVGPVHDSDFIVIGKRPEAGGTTFITDQFSGFLSQLPADKDAVIFNNEEGGDKVMFRLMQSALGMSTSDMMADVSKTKELWDKFLGTRKLDIFHKPGMSTRDVERCLRAGNYGLIGINVIEKVQGFYKADDVERRRLLGEWCRKLADKYGPVFGVVQADATAEGQKVLNMSQLYGSKTGLQGEIDVLLMIGKTNDPGLNSERWITVCKNKKPTTGQMQPALKHTTHNVTFDIEKGRYLTKGSTL